MHHRRTVPIEKRQCLPATQFKVNYIVGRHRRHKDVKGDFSHGRGSVLLGLPDSRQSTTSGASRFAVVGHYLCPDLLKHNCHGKPCVFQELQARFYQVVKLGSRLALKGIIELHHHLNRAILSTFHPIRRAISTAFSRSSSAYICVTLASLCPSMIWAPSSPNSDRTSVAALCRRRCGVQCSTPARLAARSTARR